MRAECMHMSVQVRSCARECTRVREEMESRGLWERETVFLRGTQLWFCRVPSLRVKAVVREKACVPSVFKINISQSPFRHGISRGFIQLRAKIFELPAIGRGS